MCAEPWGGKPYGSQINNVPFYPCKPLYAFLDNSK